MFRDTQQREMCAGLLFVNEIIGCKPRGTFYVDRSCGPLSVSCTSVKTAAFGRKVVVYAFAMFVLWMAIATLSHCTALGLF